MRNKLKITEKLVALLPEEERLTVDQARRSWWFNLRSNGGMRLTAPGYFAFCNDLGLECYEYKLTDPHTLNQRLILSLDRKLQMPYFITSKKGIPTSVIFFGSKEAVMTNLYGDLAKFLDNYHP